MKTEKVLKIVKQVEADEVVAMRALREFQLPPNRSTLNIPVRAKLNFEVGHSIRFLDEPKDAIAEYDKHGAKPYTVLKLRFDSSRKVDGGIQISPRLTLDKIKGDDNQYRNTLIDTTLEDSIDIVSELAFNPLFARIEIAIPACDGLNQAYLRMVRENILPRLMGHGYGLKDMDIWLTSDWEGNERRDHFSYTGDKLYLALRDLLSDSDRSDERENNRRRDYQISLSNWFNEFGEKNNLTINDISADYIFR